MHIEMDSFDAQLQARRRMHISVGGSDQMPLLIPGPVRHARAAGATVWPVSHSP
jgi:hypothetical protein